jgi:hypothetical protein
LLSEKPYVDLQATPRYHVLSKKTAPIRYHDDEAGREQKEAERGNPRFLRDIFHVLFLPFLKPITRTAKANAVSLIERERWPYVLE